MIFTCLFHELAKYLDFVQVLSWVSNALALEPNGNSTQSFLSTCSSAPFCRKDFLYLWNYLSFDFCTITYMHSNFILLVFC